MPNNTNENVSHHSSFSRQHSTQSIDSESKSQSHNVTFTTDNASDITKAITKLGRYPWLGSAGHHLNLIRQAGFKQVCAAASLVKNANKLLST